MAHFPKFNIHISGHGCRRRPSKSPVNSGGNHRIIDILCIKWECAFVIVYLLPPFAFSWMPMDWFLRYVVLITLYSNNYDVVHCFDRNYWWTSPREIVFQTELRKLLSHCYYANVICGQKEIIAFYCISYVSSVVYVFFCSLSVCVLICLYIFLSVHLSVGLFLSLSH